MIANPTGITDTAYALRPGGSGNLECYDPRRNGNDTVTNDHYETGNELPKTCDRGNVSKPNRGKGGDCPVDPGGDTGKTAVLALDQIHQCPDNNNYDQYCKEEYKYLIPAGFKGFNNNPAFP